MLRCHYFIAKKKKMLKTGDCSTARLFFDTSGARSFFFLNMFIVVGTTYLGMWFVFQSW